MRDAREALDNNQPGQAVPSQTRSLDQLQQGLQATLDQFMEMFSPGEGEGEGQVGARLVKWTSEGNLGWVFDNEEDSMSLEARFVGFAMTDFIETAEIRSTED